jgi:8-oxo-dGTP pyrophosphatase MutT (NUDIX family)
MTGRAIMAEEQLRAGGDWLGASCVARWRDSGFVFAARVEGTRLILSGVGGKVEPGETFRTAVLREFHEETGCELGPLIAAPPRHLTAEASRYPVPEGAAALIAERPPEHPSGGTLWIAVFLALLTRAPRPVEKVEIFAIVPPSSGWCPLAQLEVSALSAVVGTEALPATQVLPAAVVDVAAENTAMAVLSSPGLLREWWDATAAWRRD